MTSSRFRLARAVCTLAAAAKLPAVSGTPTFPTRGQLNKAKQVLGQGWGKAMLHGASLTAQLGSVKPLLTAALIATVAGLPLAQGLVTSRFAVLRHAVLSVSGVVANFGRVLVAFAFVATLGNAGVLTQHLYFLIPLMVLTVIPALDGLRAQQQPTTIKALP